MDQHRQELLDLAVGILKERNPGHSEAEVARTLPTFLDELIRALRLGDIPQEKRETAEGQHAAQIGAERQADGFEISSVAHTFGAFSEALGVLGTRAGMCFSAREYRKFNLCIDASIARAIESFHASAKQGAEHQNAQFVGFLAHELRNELSSAAMAYASLEQGHVPVHSKTSRVLDRSLKRMQSLIDQTLAAVRLEAGTEPERRRVRVHDLLAEIEAAAVPERQVSLTLESERPLDIVADESLLKSAINNLVQNALKFTRTGGRVSVRARRQGASVLIEIEDECGGLPPGTREELFTPFVQKGKNRKGLGLGLTIAERAVSAHGGDIAVHNLPGKGCIFAVRLPAPEAS